MAWVYELEDDDNLTTYVGKNKGESLRSMNTRINRHFGLDAEHSRHATQVYGRMVHPDDLDHEEQMSIKNANDGQGPVFNKQHNDGGWADVYSGGHNRRDGTDDVDAEAAARRRERASNNYEYEARRRRNGWA